MIDSESMRVRFAPSPTGYLHVGGARTALFNWLLARKHGGVFVLRIEDTDRDRSSADMTRAIIDGMTWLGLDWDEGPFHQADGIDRHRADALRLLDAGAAYRCFCPPGQAEGDTGYSYDRRCAAVAPDEAAARAAAGEPFTVRFRVPPGTTSWEDAVHGTISFANADLEDFIILRTDGTPIYNMAVVSDDIAMRISHVIRGDDHISNTPKQILLYEALGAERPVFAHVPMILGPDGRRLSKRHGATAIGEYDAQGILADALVNFLALLGWSPGTDQEIFSRDELTEAFSLGSINRKSAVFDTQKLEWLNGRYLAATPAAELAPVLKRAFGFAPSPDAAGDPAAAPTDDGNWWLRLTELLKVRSRTVVELVEQAKVYVDDRVVHDEAAVAKYWAKEPVVVAARLGRIAEAWSAVEAWDEAVLEQQLRDAAEAEGVGAGKLIHPLRVALTGAVASPGIFDVAALLGRDVVLRRITQGIETLRGMGGADG